VIETETECLCITGQVVSDSFDRLSSSDECEVLDEILRPSRDVDWLPLDEETIDRIADEALFEYDLVEASDGGS